MLYLQDVIVLDTNESIKGLQKCSFSVWVRNDNIGLLHNLFRRTHTQTHKEVICLSECMYRLIAVITDCVNL